MTSDHLDEPPPGAPGRRLSATVPDAVPLPGGGAAALRIEFDVGPDGTLTDVVSARPLMPGPSVEAASPKPQCFTVGNPPRTFCLVPVGGGGQGGGGTMTESAVPPPQLLVQIAPGRARGPDGGPQFDVSVIPLDGLPASTVFATPPPE